MRSWVVLLRGVNLGARNRVPMTDLRAALEGLGAQDVRTVLQSGNALLRAADRPDAAAIRRAVHERTGTDAPVVVLAAEELRAVADANPLPVEDPKRLLVAVLADPAADAPAIAELAARDWGDERIAAGERAAYLWLPGGAQRSRAWRAVERAVQAPVTARNWATVEKLLMPG